MAKGYVETTPYCIQTRFGGTAFAVVNGWTGKEHGVFASREEAQVVAVKLARGAR